jgi:hypothetical protein
MEDKYEKAFDAKVLFSDGSIQRLSDYWNSKPVLLVFLRHFG